MQIIKANKVLTIKEEQWGYYESIGFQKRTVKTKIEKPKEEKKPIATKKKK